MAMNDVGVNFEIWTLPNSGNFVRKHDITGWVVDRNIDVRFNDISSGAFAVANTCPYLDDILIVDPLDHTNDAGSTLMLFRDGIWLAALVVVEREDRASETQPWTTFAVEGLEWFLERARVRAFDYPADPIREGDWLYGAPSILKTPGGEISNDITSIYREDIVTSGSFTVTDGTTTSTTAVPWDDDGSTLKTAVEEISAITAVSVYGIGTEDFPWVVEVNDPAGTPIGLLIGASTLDGDLFVNAIRTGGDISPRPWHGSVDAVANQLIGGYESFEIVQAGVGSHPTSDVGSTYLLHLDGATPSALGDNPGMQIEASVVGLHRYRSTLVLQAPDNELQLRLSVRDMSNNTIAATDYTLNPVQGWVSIPIVDPENPGDPDSIFTMHDVSTVYVRVGILAEDGVNPGSLYLDYEASFLAPGAPASTWGEINNDLLAPMVARGVLDWVDPTWTDALDSSGETWDADRAMGIRRGQTMYQVQEYGRRWGYEHLLTYNGDTAVPFDWGLFNPGNAGTDYTGLGGPSIKLIDGMLDSGVKVLRAPDATYAIAEGDAGQWGESIDADLATGWGRLEGYFANRQNREGLSTLAQRMVEDSAAQATGRRVRVQNPVTTPLDTYLIADTIPTILPTPAGPTDTKSMRIMGVTIGQSDEPAPFYDVHLDSMVFDPEAAQADAVRTLIRAYEALDNLGAGGSIDPLFTRQNPAPPPSAPSGRPSLDPLGWTEFTQDGPGTPTEVLVPYETGVAGDIVLMVCFTDGTAPPAPWVLIEEVASAGDGDLQVYGLLTNGSESGTVSMNSPSRGQYATNRVYATGATLSLDDIVAVGATGTVNPPAVTLPANTYEVLAIAGLKSFGATFTGGPTGYTSAVELPSPSSLFAGLFIYQKSVTGPGTEDPSTYTFSNTDYLDLTAMTIGVKVSPSDPLVAPFDHDHVEADITDLDHTTTVKKSGTLVGTRSAINFIPGTGVTIDAVDDAGNDEIDVTISSTGGGGGGGALDPDAIDDLVMWLKADQISGTDGDALATWSDQSGNSNDMTQATTGAKPTYKTGILNSLPIVRFDATDDGMVSSLSLSAPFSIFYVANVTGSSGTRRAIQGRVNNWLLGPYSGLWQWYGGSFATNVGTASTTFKVHGVTQVVGSGTHFLAPRPADVFPNSGTYISAVLASPGNPGQIALGASGAFAEVLGGDIAEVIVYSRAITFAEGESLIAYLVDKYAL